MAIKQSKGSTHYSDFLKKNIDTECCCPLTHTEILAIKRFTLYGFPGELANITLATLVLSIMNEISAI